MTDGDEKKTMGVEEKKEKEKMTKKILKGQFIQGEDIVFISNQIE
jgi:hypothetical protein